MGSVDSSALMLPAGTQPPIQKQDSQRRKMCCLESMEHLDGALIENKPAYCNWHLINVMNDNLIMPIASAGGKHS